MIKVLYTGSFDPITKGHMNIVKQASQLFDGVVIAVLQNKNKKNSFFTIDERYEIIKELYKDSKNIEVIKGNKDSLIVDGKVQDNNSIKLKNDKSSHEVTLYMKKK